MRKFTLLILISFIGIGLYAQNIRATKNYNQSNQLSNSKITKTNFNNNLKSAKASYISESFEGTTFPPTGWTKLNPGGGTGWARQVAGATLPGWNDALGNPAVAPAAPTGGGTAYANANWNTGSSASSNDQILVSPAVTIGTGAMLNFNLMMYNNTVYEDSFEVLISTNSTTFTTVLADYDTLDFTTAQTWVPVSISLASYIGQTVYIAFREHIFDNAVGGSLFCLDLVTIGTAPSNDVAVQSIDMPYLNAPGTVAPTATVVNIGSTAQTFNVTMTINPGAYTSTIPVTALAGGASQQVTFSNWTATTGNYQVIVTAALTGDVDLTNNADTTNIVCWAADPILFDNTAIAADQSIISMKFGGLASGANIVECSDDFDVPTGNTWTVTSIYVNGTPSAQALTTTIDSFAVNIYSDNSALPGTLLHKASVALAMEGTNLDTAQTLALATPITLTPGKYWISVMAVYDTATGLSACRWNWKSGPNYIGDTCVLQTTTTFFGAAFAWTRLWDLGVGVERSFYFTINGTTITGIDNNNTNEISIYPNPSNGMLNITNAENANVVVYNLLGEVVANSNCNSAFSTVDLSNLSNGQYIVKVVSDKNTVTKKINIVK